MTNVMPDSLAEKIILEKITEWEEKRKKRKESGKSRSHQFLTVSRDFGSKEEIVLPALERKLGWNIYGKDLLKYIVEREGVSRAVLETLDEKSKGRVFDWVNYILGSGAIIQKEYVLKVSRLIKTIVLQESAIILGRGGNQILKDMPGGLRIKITAPFDDRVAHISQVHNITLEAAKDMVLKKDRERMEFVETCFHKKSQDLSEFDMILNTKYFSEDSLCRIVQIALKEKHNVSHVT